MGLDYIDIESPQYAYLLRNSSVLNHAKRSGGSTLSLAGNDLPDKPGGYHWGYSYLIPPVLEPELSELHYNRSFPRSVIRIGYSVDDGDYLKYAEAVGLGGPTSGSFLGTYGIGEMRIYDYNRAYYGGYNLVRPPSQLDEMDRRAPNFTQYGPPIPTLIKDNAGPVVSQIYKSVPGRTYKDLGPRGRY